MIDPATSDEPSAAASRERERAPGRPPLVVVQTASATSTRLRDEPNAYQRICIDNGRVLIRARVWSGSAFTNGVELDADETRQLQATA